MQRNVTTLIARPHPVPIKRITYLFTLLLVLLILLPTGHLQADDDMCLACHEGMEQTLATTAHRLQSDDPGNHQPVTCISCHPGAEGHLENPDRGTITNPDSLTGFALRQICNSCHVAHVSLDDYGFDAHDELELDCGSCHKVHGGEAGLLLNRDASFCMGCHEQMVPSHSLVSQHPVLQGNVTCLSCHQFTRQVENDFAFQTTGGCASCHAEQTGPFLYEHDAVNAYAVEGGGCTECHTPHGSPNDRLLIQPREMICQQCHIKPSGHLSNSVHGYVWSQYDDCTLCHSQVHGSFESRLFLDPNLPDKFDNVNCYDAGCHSVNP